MCRFAAADGLGLFGELRLLRVGQRAIEGFKRRPDAEFRVTRCNQKRERPYRMTAPPTYNGLTCDKVPAAQRREVAFA